MFWDLKLFVFFNNLAEQSHFFDLLVVFFASYLQYILILIFVLFLFYSRHKIESWRIFWVTILSAGLARYGVTEIIRFFYHRPRPFMVLQIHQLLTDNEWSFPSGHSTFFFALATAIYLYNKKWGLGFLVAAILMNISRIIAGVHYPTDILGGAFIGVLVAHIFFYFIEPRKSKKLTI